MKLIAIHTIHGGRKVMRAADPKNRVRGQVGQENIAKPGTEFDTIEFGIEDDEAQSLIARGAAKRKLREVTDADEAKAGAGAAGAAAT